MHEKGTKYVHVKQRNKRECVYVCKGQTRGCIVQRFETRRISCLLRLSLLPEMGQISQISRNKPEEKCLATVWLTSFATTTTMLTLQCPQKSEEEVRLA